MDEQSIFLKALDQKSPAECAAWLAYACGNDAALRARVEALLTRRREHDKSAEQPPVTIVTEVGRAPRTEIHGGGLATVLEQREAVATGAGGHSVLESLSQVMKVPRVVLRESPETGSGPILRPKSSEMPQRDSKHRYQLQGEIARGGMGAILKGRDADLGRDLAIKVLLDQHKDNPEIVERFIEEAQIGGQLQHPGITPVYELGQFADARPYFSMKLVKGETLSKLLADRADATVERGKMLGIFEHVCQTMAYAHSRGVIHRDLKPANVMVGAFGEVQVMDWGLAKVLSVGGVADERKAHDQQSGKSVVQTLRSKVGSDAPGTVGSVGTHTQMGSVMGTPAYMPPEQALGEIDHLDERADVFGLGAILCEILTGAPPYVAQNGTEVFRLASRGKLDDCFDRLSQCGADSDLIALAKQCLALDPKDRPRDAGVLAERVSSYLETVEVKLRASETEAAVQTERFEQQQRSARKLQRMLGGLAVVSLLAIGTSLVAGKFWNDAEIAREAAKQEAKRANDQEQTALRERDAARQAELKALDQSYLAKRSEITALRMSRQAGWRAAALDGLQQLVKLGSRNLDLIDLRTEALACISQMDVHLQAQLGDKRFSAWRMAYSLDGRLIAIEDENRISIQDVQSKKELHSIASTQRAPFAFHSSGALVLPKETGRISYHALVPGQKLPPDLVGSGDASGIAFSSSGDRAAVVWSEQGKAKRVQVFSTETGESLWRADLPADVRQSYKVALAITPDGQHVATHGSRWEINLHTVGSNQPPVVLGKVDDRLCGLSFHPSGKLLVAAGVGVGIAWELPSHSEQFRFHVPVGGIWDVKFSPSGQLIGTITNDGIVRFWDSLTGRELLSAPTSPATNCLSLAFSPTTEEFAVCGGAPKVYQIVGRQECRHDYSVRNNVSAVAFDPHRAALLASGGDNQIHVWKLGEPAFSGKRPSGRRRPEVLRVSPDGAHLAQGYGNWSNDNNTDYAVSVWSVDDSTQEKRFEGPRGMVRDLTFDAAGRTLAAASDDGGLYLWDFPSGELRKRIELKPHLCRFMSASELLVAANDYLLVVDPRSGQIRRQITLPARAQALTLTPDARHAIVASNRQSVHRVQLVDKSQVEQSRTIADLSPRPSLALAPDGKLLIVTTTSQQRNVLLDPMTLEPLAQLPNVDLNLRETEFAPGGQFFAMGGSELALWDFQMVGAELTRRGLAFGGLDAQEPGPWLLGAIERAPGRAAKAELIASAAKVPGLLDELVQRFEKNLPVQLELARYFAGQGVTERALQHRALALALSQQQLEQDPDSLIAAQGVIELRLPLVELQALVPTSEKARTPWRYTTSAPGEGWYQTDFKAAGWLTGSAPFATGHLVERNTDWTTREIWLRHDFELKSTPTTDAIPLLQMLCDDTAEVYLNGTLITRQLRYRSQYAQYELPLDTLRLLRSGQNTLAVHCVNTEYHGVIDAGLYLALGKVSQASQELAVQRIGDPWAQLAAIHHLAGDQAALQNLLKRHPVASAGLGDMYATVQDWPQAIAAYTAALSVHPDNVSMLTKRAEAFEKSTDWDRAMADWRRVTTLQPSQVLNVLDHLRSQSRWNEAGEFAILRAQQNPKDSLAWLAMAPVLAMGDQADYEAFCHRVLKQFPEYANANQAEQVLKACLLRPGTIEITQQPADYVVILLDADKASDQFGPWAWGTRALLAHRTGDAEMVVKAVRKSEALRPHPYARSLNMALQAMAEHQLKHPEAARRALDEAIRVLGNLPETNTVNHDIHIAQLLINEAKALLESPP